MPRYHTVTACVTHHIILFLTHCQRIIFCFLPCVLRLTDTFYRCWRVGQQNLHLLTTHKSTHRLTCPHTHNDPSYFSGIRTSPTQALHTSPSTQRYRTVISPLILHTVALYLRYCVATSVPDCFSTSILIASTFSTLSSISPSLPSLFCLFPDHLRFRISLIPG